MSLTHHRRVEHLIELERQLFRELADRPSLLGPRELDIFRYAFSLARMGQLRVGLKDIDLFELIAPFRHWLIEQLDYFVDSSPSVPRVRAIVGASGIDWRGIAKLIPQIRNRIEVTRSHVLSSSIERFSEETFERELTIRKLVLVLGGGGGSGYPHLGVFTVMSELGIVPSMIVGSSMGALLGLFRACTVEYEPMLISMGLPRPRDFRKAFSPYRGYTRYGFPGVFEMKMRPIGREIFNTMLGRSIPRLDELPIQLRPVVTGLLTGIDIELSKVEAEISKAEGAFSPLRFGKRLRLFSATANMLVQNSKNLVEVPFGRVGPLQSFDAVDATGFSCSVPGVIHYDIFRKDSESGPTLRSYMKQNGIFRITDGGVVSNVPSRIAWDCVESGELDSRNAFIVSFDAFAPQLNMNAPFVPIQQVIGRSVRDQRKFSHYHVTYKNPPSPVKLLQSLDSIESVVSRTRDQLREDRAFFSLMMRPIPQWNELTAT